MVLDLAHIYYPDLQVAKNIAIGSYTVFGSLRLRDMPLMLTKPITIEPVFKLLTHLSGEDSPHLSMNGISLPINSIHSH